MSDSAAAIADPAGTVDAQLLLQVLAQVKAGDVSARMPLDWTGVAGNFNAMVDQLNDFISEVTWVAREVGTEGKLGQAAAVTIEVGGVCVAGERERCIDAGANECIAKPIDASGFLSILARLLPAKARSGR